MLQFKVCSMILLSFYWISLTHAAEILGIFIFPARNHFNFHEAMMRSLLAAGHRVTVIAPFPSQIYHQNYTIINSTTDISLNLDASTLKAISETMGFFVELEINIRVSEQYCNRVLSLQEMKTLNHFDVLFVETMDMFECFTSLAIKHGVPIIGTISARSYRYSDFAVGNSRIASFFPSMFVSAQNEIAFLDRLFNFISQTLDKAKVVLAHRKFQELFENAFPNQDTSNSKIALLFTNDHACIQERASTPNTINIGGIQVKSAVLSPLTEPIKTFIEEAKHGVILFSLGSLIDIDMAIPKINTILKETFAYIPQRVLCKHGGNIDGLPQNILLSPWLPQKEILEHKNVIAFISHAGQGSLYEAIYFAKPMILLPFFVDQPGNAALIQNLGAGLTINPKKLNEGELLDAINEVVHNSKYRENMLQLSRKFKDQPKSPEELVIYWTDYVLRHKNISLRTSEADIPLYQYLLLDVMIFVLFVMAFIGFLFRFIIRKISNISLAKKNFVT